MTLENANLIVQIVTGIAAVISLIYVGMQIRQHTRATRVAAVQRYQEMFGELQMVMISDPGFAELMMKGAAFDELTPLEKMRLTFMYRHILMAWETAHYMHRSGVLDDGLWRYQENLFVAVMRQDHSLRAHFERERPSLDPAFAAFVEAVIARQPVFDLVPQRRSPEGAADAAG